MPEPGKSDKWNSLLETLGVPATEPPPKAPEAAAEPPKAASAPPPRMAKPAPKPKASPPAAKSPSYWSRIAGALGLETPAVPEPEPVPPTPAPPAPVAERPARSQESGGRGREAQPDRNAPPPRKLESMFGPKEPDVDVFGLDQGSDRIDSAGGLRSADEPPRQSMHREPPASRREPPPSRREPPPSRREPPPSRREPPAGRGEPPSSRREPPPGREAPPPAFSAEDDEGFVLDYEVEGDSDLNLGEEPVAPVSEASDESSDRGGPPRGERRDSAAGPRGDSAGGLRDSEDGPREGGRRRRGRRRGRGRGGRREDGPPTGASAPPPPRFQDQDDDLEEYGPPAEAEFEREPEFDLDEGSDLDLGPALPPAARGNEADDRLPPRRPQRSESAGGRGESTGGPRDDEREGRSRRGRRGGRGRGRGDRERERPPAGPRPTDYGPGPRSESGGGLRNERLEDDLPLDEEAADIELAGEPEEDEGPASGHPTHKKIPTWEEAVGILVEANMAARADRPDRDRGRGGGGGGGGRGRGGRGRGGGGGERR